jgi:hypothetical protein
MIDDRNFNPPAMVREDLEERDLIAQAKTLQSEIVQAERMNLKRARDLGFLLMRLKKANPRLYCKALEEIGVSTQRASEYVRIAKSRAPGLLQCGSIREALQLIAQEKGSAEPEEGYGRVDGMFVPLALDPAISYFGTGVYEPRDGKYASRVLPGVEPGSEVWLELDAHPDHAGYWVSSFHFGLPAGDGYSIACGRGMRLEAGLLPHILRKNGMRPVEWIEIPARPHDEIDAIRWYAEDFESICQNRKPVSDWVADLLYPPNECEEVVFADEPDPLPQDEMGPYAEGY